MRKLIKIIQKLRRQENLGCYIISRKPLILISYWHDFIFKYKDKIIENLPKGKKIYVIFQFGYYKNAENAEQIKDEITKIQSLNPKIRYIFLNNTIEENSYFKQVGLETYYINQNAFLDENRYRIYSRIKKEYKAVYLARMTPAKRHQLVAAIPDLLLIGSYFEFEKDHVDMVLSKITYRKWITKIPHFMVSRYLNKAKVALALSDVEGAMFVSTEYFLSGLPQVSTKSVGGRDVFFADYDTIIVDDDPQAVADGVEEMIKRNPDPFKIRNRVIGVMEEHRSKFRKLLGEIMSDEGVTVDILKEWENIFYHKMGLRMHVPRKVYRERILKPGMILEV